MAELLPLFEWLDQSFLASLAKANGGVFVVVQMFHLLGLSLLGGMVLLCDLRLLGLVLNEVPLATVARETQRWLGRALIVMVVSGVFMSAAVALKLYHSEMYWAKMTSLLVAVLFVYAIKGPLLRDPEAELSTFARAAIATASLGLWLTVAGAGRWIGFS